MLCDEEDNDKRHLVLVKEAREPKALHQRGLPAGTFKNGSRTYTRV